MTENPLAMSRFQRMGRAALHRALENLEGGAVEIRDALGTRVFGTRDGSGPTAVMEVHDPDLYAQVLSGGSLGAAEAWMRGAWSCSDLTALFRLILSSWESVESLDAGRARLARLGARLAHALRANSRKGSRRNIRDHYDLGNDFFALFLDPSMTYSCGLFERPDATLEEASIAKYERLCRRLELGPEHRVLEIGTGWGGFALHAASRHGCRVTTTTISERQFELAGERIAKAGLQDRVTLLLEDYRDLRGRFDRVVSIEMIEAVGHRYLDGYFRVCSDRLEPHGAMGLQAITIRDQRHQATLRDVDFIQKYIFPGGQLPSLGSICASTGRAGDLQVREVVDLTPHYVRTLQEWRARFLQNREAIRRLGYAEELLRLWEYYLCYCEAGFLERNTACQQILLTRSACSLGSA